MKAVEMRKVVPIPEGVSVEIVDKRVTVSGPLGTLSRDFSDAPVHIEKRDGSVEVVVWWPRKREAAMLGTVASHIKNMIMGVTQGYTYKMKMIYAHFPMSVRVEGDRVLIENFGGERAPRVAKVMPGVKVVVKGEDVYVMGIDKEAVGQTAANIQLATRVKDKDPRVFLDGIYVEEKRVGMEVA